MSSINAIAKQLTGRTPPLFPVCVWKEDLTRAIEALNAPPLVKAAFHLWNDDLERCHAIAQQHEGDPVADHLHAILHRREREFSNARYWYRQVSIDRAEVDAYEKAPESDELKARQAAEMRQVLEKALTGKNPARA